MQQYKLRRYPKKGRTTVGYAVSRHVRLQGRFRYITKVSAVILEDWHLLIEDNVAF